MVKPAAKPSKPSIQFIAFVVPAIHQTVKNKLKEGGRLNIGKFELNIAREITFIFIPRPQTITAEIS